MEEQREWLFFHIYMVLWKISLPGHVSNFWSFAYLCLLVCLKQLKELIAIIVTQGRRDSKTHVVQLPAENRFSAETSGQDRFKWSSFYSLANYHTVAEQ